MGGLLAGALMSPSLILLTFLVAAGTVTLRRRLEMSVPGAPARPALAAYSSRRLLILELTLLASIGVLRLTDSATAGVFYAVALATYVSVVFGARILPPLRRVLVDVWTG
jgi:hypothetical protein